MTWILQMCTSATCNPCKPPPPPTGNGPGTGLTFTDAEITIDQIQINTDLRGNTINYGLGSMIFYSAIDNIPPQGVFGNPLGFGPQSSVASSVVIYRSFITIRHPYYPSGSYNDALPDTTTGLLQPTLSPGDGSQAANQAASTAAGNAAIAQANAILNQGSI